MAEYKTFRIEFSTILDNGSAIAKVTFADDDTEYEDEILYKMELTDIDKFGPSYVDNVAEKLLAEAVDKLIEQKKEFRKTVFNIYDDI